MINFQLDIFIYRFIHFKDKEMEWMRRGSKVSVSREKKNK